MKTVSSKPLFIIINGAPATGKTFVAKEISNQLYIPYFSKDDIKSILVDVLGSGENVWIKKLAHASSSVLRLVIEQVLSKNSSIIVDQVFDPEIIALFIQKLKKKYDFSVIQVFCKCDLEVALNRYLIRSQTSERNSGFHEKDWIKEVKRKLQIWKPAEVKGKLFEIDTTNISNISKQIEIVVKGIKKQFII